MMHWFRGIAVLFILLSNPVLAQKTEIILGPPEIGENQFWTITVSVHNDQFRNYDMFPDIEGFRKRGTSSQSQTSIINGQMSSVQSVVMSYQPLRQGTFTLPPFKMKVNGQTLSSQGMTIRVGPMAQNQARDPFSAFFDRDPSGDGRRETEYIDVKEDAFLALTTSKKDVYMGEGFTATLSFLISETNRATMQFYELGEQLPGILKQLRPEACWEENFNIENIEGERVEINGKGFTEYKIYQAAFYPLNDKPISFPSVGLNMIKFKVAKNPSFFGQNRKEDFKMFYTKPVTIRVKPLPPHPMRESVAVGQYRLEEKLSAPEASTGKSVNYTFRVAGEGNISGIPLPTVVRNSRLELFDPNIKQEIGRRSGRVVGSKTFSYFMIPVEPGEYPLAENIFFVFFDPKKAKYDTLRPEARLVATGENRQGQQMTSQDATSFYDRINDADNALVRTDGGGIGQVLLNLFILLALGGSVYFMFRKPS